MQAVILFNPESPIQYKFKLYGLKVTGNGNGVIKKSVQAILLFISMVIVSSILKLSTTCISKQNKLSYDSKVQPVEQLLFIPVGRVIEGITNESFEFVGSPNAIVREIEL